MIAKRIGIADVMLLISLAFLLTACSEQEEAPTPVPVASVPTLAPSPTSLPPTTDLTAIADVPEPTADMAPPTVTPAPTSTAAPITSAINIAVPDPGADIILGSDIVARGLVRLIPEESAWLALVAPDGQVLAESEARVQDGGWEAGLTVPHFISGVADLRASVRDGNGEIRAEATASVHLAIDTDHSERYLALFRPVAGDQAMGGYNLFFDGRAQLPVNNTVTISVHGDNCRTQVARQSFVLRGSGYWQGFVIIPNTVSGPGCAVARFGTPGDENWREVQIPIDIAANDTPGISGVTIGNPRAGVNIAAGQEFLLYGTALNASETSIQVSILLENGRIVSQSSTLTDLWGYWELPVILPVDVEGPAAITATAGEPGDDGFSEAETLITINPAPTPSP